MAAITRIMSMTGSRRIVGLGLTWLALATAHAENGFVQLTGWGGGKPEEVVPQAAEAGFTELIVVNHDTNYLYRLVEAGRPHGIGAYACIHLSDIKDWQKRRPGIAPPLQEMNPEENAALARVEADQTRGKSCYQYGGEPHQPVEVLTSPLLCFHTPEVVEFFKEQVRDILAGPGLKGVAFDFFGYRNYRCCRCARSMAAFEAWHRQHPALARDKALDQFSLETLVDFTNTLARYARSLRPGIKVQCHVYPVFLPEPLYGNRLDVDYCGQTAAWYFEPLWDMEKIRDYTRVIFGQEKKYFQRAKGVALVGVYNRPDLYPVKGPDRLAQELQAILDGGGDRVQVCSFNDVLNDPPTLEVFKRFFKKTRPSGEPRR
jgi:hypothetical protein